MRRASLLGVALLVVACGASGRKGSTLTGLNGAGASGTPEFGPAEMATLCSLQADVSPCDTKKHDLAAPFDLNNDGEPDVWRVLAEKDDKTKFVGCKLVDLDHDPKRTIDLVQVFTQDGYLVLEQFDFDFDGVKDAQYRYDPQRRVRFLAERDMNGNGTWDTCEEYSDGKLARIQRDRNHDGKPDQWELYADDRVSAVLYDNDGDGRVDDRDEAPRETPKPQPETTP